MRDVRVFFTRVPVVVRIVVAARASADVPDGPREERVTLEPVHGVEPQARGFVHHQHVVVLVDHVERRGVRDEGHCSRRAPQRRPNSIGRHPQRVGHLLARPPVPEAQPPGVLEQLRLVRLHRVHGGGDVAPLLLRDGGHRVRGALAQVFAELIRVGSLDELATRGAGHRGSTSARRLSLLLGRRRRRRRRRRVVSVAVRIVAGGSPSPGGGRAHRRELARGREPRDPSRALELGEARGGDAHAFRARARGLERADDGELLVVGLAARVVPGPGERRGRRRGRGHDEGSRPDARVPTRMRPDRTRGFRRGHPARRARGARVGGSRTRREQAEQA